MIDFFGNILTMITDNIFPIAMIIAIGYFLEKKFAFDIKVMSKLNFFVFVPCYMFVHLYSTEFDPNLLKMVPAELMIFLFMTVLGGLYAKRRGFSKEMGNHFQNAMAFNNMGNVGVPLMTLVFSSEIFLVDGEPVYLTLALSVLLILMTTQNITLNSWGFYKGFSATGGSPKEALLRTLKIPILYAVLLVVMVRLLNWDLTENPAYVAVNYIEGGMVPSALLTLGIQVGKSGISFKNKKVFETVFMKMVLSFAAALLVNFVLGFDGVYAQVLTVATMTPIAVNVALVAIEVKSQEEYTSQAVVFSTLITLVLLPFFLYLIRWIYPIV